MQGNILLYAAFITTASATVTEAKGVLVLSLNVFKFPPGKEPNKTVDDGKGGRTALPEKEDNPISAKVCIPVPLVSYAFNTQQFGPRANLFHGT